MPNRILRDGIITSEAVNALSWPAEIFYRRLHSVVDDFGRFSAHPSLLRAALFPLRLNDVSDRDVDKWLAENAAGGLVKVYEVDGKRFLEVAKFDQRVRAEKSKYPQPPDSCQSNDGHLSVKGKSTAGLDGDEGGDVDEGGVGAPALGPDGPPACPQEAIVALYHEVLTECPRVLEWNDTRQGYMRARWREKSKPNGTTKGYRSTDDGLRFWRGFFEYVGQSDFLTGKSLGKDGKPPFVADLEWLIKPSNFAKVIEGKYHR